jgi:predicted alpha/beta hydrolase
VNKTIQLSCRAESIPPPNVTWIRNGRLVTNDSSGRFVVQTSGTFVKSSTLTISSAQYIDRGTYECLFSNYRGVINTTTTLEVYGKKIENNTWAREDMKFIFECSSLISHISKRPCIISNII